MSTRQRPLGVRISERSHGNCSPGYLWLRERVGRLRKRMAVRYPPYDEVAAEMAAEGIMGGVRDKQRVRLTGKAVRRMWERAVRDADEDRARRPPKRQMPPPGWRSQPVAERPPPFAPPQRIMAPGSQADEDEAEASLRRLDEDMARRSGRHG